MTAAAIRQKRLMSRTTALAVLVTLAVLMISVVYDYAASAALRNEEQSISQFQSSASFLESHPVTSVAFSTTTSFVTSVLTSITISVVTSLVTPSAFPNIPWTCCAVEFLSGPDGSNVPITGGNLSSALLFDCTNAATMGCSIEEYDSMTGTNASIVARYPVVNQTGEPAWANCQYLLYEEPSGQPLPGYDNGPTFGYCITIGSNSFVVAQPGPPNPGPP